MTVMLPGALMLAACGPHHASWKEEVALSPTETVIVERSVTFKMVAEMGYTPVPFPESQTIVIKPSGSTDIRWTSSLEPLYLGRDQTSGNLVLVATSRTCEQWKTGGKPIPPYLAVEWTGTAWKARRVPVSFTNRPTNLLQTWTENESGLVTDDDRRRRDGRDSGLAMYQKSIVSEFKGLFCGGQY